MNEQSKLKSLRLLIPLLLAVFLLATLSFSSVFGGAQEDGDLESRLVMKAGAKGNDALARLTADTNGEAQISYERATGVASFIRFSEGAQLDSLVGASAEEKASAFFAEYGDAVGIQDAGKDLALVENQVDQYGTTRIVYRQIYKGLPVFGSQLLVHFNQNNRISAVNGAIVPDIKVNPVATISADLAGQAAIAEVAGQLADNQSVSLDAAGAQLLIFRDGFVQGIPGTNHLAYQVEVTDGFGAVREFVFIDAHNGKVLDQISGIHEGLDREIYLEALDADHLVWEEGDAYPYVGDEEEGINKLIRYAEDAHTFFMNISGGTYDSYDGNGATMKSVYNDPRINCPNANWNGVSTNYCTGVDGADTVVHEWTHAYTDFTHDLIYQWQPGALNESFSDIFGEAVDMTNGEAFTPNGPRTADACSVYTRVTAAQLTVNSPASIVGDYDASLAAFGPVLTSPFTGTLKAADDGSAVPTEACNPLTNDLTGDIAFIRRGSCSFVTKTINAQNAGAVGVVVANHVDGGDSHFSMAGQDPSITIPSLMIGYTDGNTIEAELANGVNATMKSLASGVQDDSYRWLSGEGDTAFGGAIRDMWNPTCYNDPAEVISDEYMCGTADSGGVHTNSGVPNHAFALLVDGGTYNGQTVGSIGLTKAVAIYWRAMSVYQTATSDFVDHADALEASCADLTGQDIYDLVSGAVSSEVISAVDCAEIPNAMLAVEMREDPTAQCGFEPLLENPPPAVCAGMGSPVDIYNTTFDTDGDGWMVSTDTAFPAVDPLTWELTTTLPATYTGQVDATFFAIDERDGSCSADPADPEEDSRVLHLDSPEITIPANATHPRVSFWHYIASELDWDGGNVKISVNGGDWQVVEGRFFTFNPYNGSIETAANGNTNPLAGEEAFTGTDGGHVIGSWGQSQVNVSRYAKPGDSIKLRFDFGSDGCNGVKGWYVDNVDVYYCDGQVDPDIAVFADGVEDFFVQSFELSSVMSEGNVERHDLDILNTGISTLTWDIEQENIGSSFAPGDLNAMAQINAVANRPAVNAVSAAGVVQDPSFELGGLLDGSPNPYWTEQGSVFPPICSLATCGAPLAWTGDYYLWFGGLGGAVASTSSVSQTITIPPLNTQFSMIVGWVADPGSVVTVTLDGAPVLVLDDSTPWGVFSEQTADISAYANGGTYELMVQSQMTGSNVFIDDVAIDRVPCFNLSNIPWLGVSQTSGETLRDEMSNVSVYFDSTGLAPGLYEGNLCIGSNVPADLGTKQVVVPVSLRVLYDMYMPAIFR